jgi:hypothetical protein
MGYHINNRDPFIMKNRKLSLPALLLAFATLTGCSTVTVNDYADSSLVFDPMIFFNNQLIAEGIVRDRSGKVTRTFTADIKASWDEQGGILDEVFEWSDGEEQTRVWTFTKTDDQQYVGTAGDVIGEAPMVHAGNAINMAYVLDVPLANGKTIAINMDDWLYLTSENTIVNVTSMTKFGFRVGEVVLTMRVVEP